MSAKKLHEIGTLAALIAGTAKLREAKDVIDVGAVQGYLALVLAFEYQLSVIAVDACAHHADVTNKRVLRIQKCYNARSRKFQQGTGESSAALSTLLPAIQESNSSEDFTDDRIVDHDERPGTEGKDCGVVLAGLHAYGDLSATMLRTFIECKEVAAVIKVGCYYNLLSDETSTDTKKSHGFPMSETVGSLDNLQLGRSARDLACQVISHVILKRNITLRDEAREALGVRLIAFVGVSGKNRVPQLLSCPGCPIPESLDCCPLQLCRRWRRQLVLLEKVYTVQDYS